MAVTLPLVHLKVGEGVIDPFLRVSRPMPANIFVYYLCSGLSDVCFAVFAYRAVIQRMKVFALLWLLYCVYDVLLYLWCYNEKTYYYLPYGIMILIAFKIIRK